MPSNFSHSIFDKDTTDQIETQLGRKPWKKGDIRVDHTTGKHAYFDGSNWVDMVITIPVTSVFGRTGDVVAAASDYAHTQLSGVSSDQHHAQIHEAAHKSGGGDAFLTTDVLEAIVKRMQESGGPTTLTMGAVADGQNLQRSGSTIVGATPAGSSALALSDRIITSDFTLATNKSAYVAGELEIASGVVVDLGSNAVLEIG